MDRCIANDLPSAIFERLLDQSGEADDEVVGYVNADRLARAKPVWVAAAPPGRLVAQEPGLKSHTSRANSMDPLQLVMSSMSVTARIIQYLKRVPVCFVEGANAMKFRITNMTHSGELIAFWPAGLNKKHKTDAYSFFFKQKDHPRVGRIIDLLREGPVVANIFDGVMFRRGVIGMARHALLFTPWSTFLTDLKRGVIPAVHGSNLTRIGKWYVQFGGFSIGATQCRARKIIEFGRFLYMEFDPSLGVSDFGGVNPPAKLTISNDKGQDISEFPGEYQIRKWQESSSGPGFVLFYRWSPPHR